MMIRVTRTETTVSDFDRGEVLDMLCPDEPYRRHERAYLTRLSNDALAYEFGRQFTAEAEVGGPRFDSLVRDIDARGVYEDDWTFEVTGGVS